MQNEIVLFETKDKEVRLNVSVDGENVWLNYLEEMLRQLVSILIMR